jgi:hypothetical protein
MGPQALAIDTWEADDVEKVRAFYRDREFQSLASELLSTDIETTFRTDPGRKSF